MVGWHPWLSGHEFEQVLGDGEGQGSLVAKSQTQLRNFLKNNNKRWPGKKVLQEGGRPSVSKAAERASEAGTGG